MKDVFVVCPREEHFNIFYGNFRHLPIHFSWAHDLGTALKYLELEQPSFVFMVHEDFEILMEWIERYRNFDINIPFLCFTRQVMKKVSQDILKAGAMDILFLPMNIKELGYILNALVLSLEIQKSPDIDLVEGRLEDFNLIHLIQTFEDGKKSGVLVLEDGIKKGEIEFSNGSVINAQYSNREPLEAVTIMSAWQKGLFRARQNTLSHKKRIALTNQQIIIECLNYISLQEKLLSKLPAKNEILFASPQLDFEELSPRDRNQLLAFKDGNNLEEIMQMFTGNMNQLLKKMETWIEKNWLVRQGDFEQLKRKVKEEEDKSAFKKVMEKVLSKTKHDKEAEKFQARYSFLEKTDIIQTQNKRPNEFRQYQRLQDFLKVLEGMA